MYCRNCGKEIDESFNCCPYCGFKQIEDNTKKEEVKQTKGNVGWAVLGFFIPLVGLILYLVWNDTKPLDAHQAGKGALISVIVGAITTAITFITMMILIIVSLFTVGI